MKTLRSKLRRILRDHPEAAQKMLEALVEVASDPTLPCFAAAQRIIWERHDGPADTIKEVNLNVVFRKKYVDDLEIEAHADDPGS